MLPIKLTVGPLASGVADYYVASVTPTSGTALTLAHTSTPDVPRRVLATFGSEASARTLRVTGTNADNNPIRETLAIPASAPGTAETVQDFNTITEIMPLGGGWSAALTVGTDGVASSPWKLTNAEHQAVSEITWDCRISGTVNYSIEYTMIDINSNQYAVAGTDSSYPPVPPVSDLSAISAKSANFMASVDNPIMAWRAKINSGTGTLTVYALEGGMTEGR